LPPVTYRQKKLNFNKFPGTLLLLLSSSVKTKTAFLSLNMQFILHSSFTATVSIIVKREIALKCSLHCPQLHVTSFITSLNTLNKKPTSQSLIFMGNWRDSSNSLDSIKSIQKATHLTFLFGDHRTFVYRNYPPTVSLRASFFFPLRLIHVFRCLSFHAFSYIRSIVFIDKTKSTDQVPDLNSTHTLICS